MVGLWLSTRELPGYAPKKQIPYTLHLMKGGKQNLAERILRQALARAEAQR